MVFRPGLDSAGLEIDVAALQATIGESPRRREDATFLTGQAAYLDDLAIDGLCHAVFLRSPHAHARIDGIGIDAARAVHGVLSVLTAADVAHDCLVPLPPVVTAHPKTGAPFAFLPQPLLAGDVVRYAGEAVAMVVAETLSAAEDAADRLDVRYTPLPAVTDARAAGTPAAPEIAASLPGNLCLEWATGDPAATAAAFRDAAHVTELTLSNHRIVTHPMETRGAIGIWDAAAERYLLHVSSQNIHAIRDATAGSLGVPRAAVRLVAPAVGGGFGTKNFPYVEYPLIAWAARRVGRPVKWVASRSEAFLVDHQARDHHATARLALASNGRFLGLEVESVANLGAYLVGSMGTVETVLYGHLPGTIYAIPTVALHIAAVFTNTTPLGVTRAPGYSEANAIIERLIDVAARESGIDRTTLRRLNLVPAESMPFRNALGESVDSGSFCQTLDTALERADIAGFAQRRRASEAVGQLRGLGFACHVKGTGGSPHENVAIRFETDGTVSLVTGTQTIGQGHHTTFPQILGTLLGLPDRTIRLLEGDTDLIPQGGGHGSSRSTYMAGTAMVRAVDEIVAKGLAIAAEALEVAIGDIRFEAGQFSVAGTDHAIGLLEVAAMGRCRGQDLDTYHAWTRDWMTFPNGAHVVEIEIDRETGRLRIDRYTAVDDYGVLINPMIARGQVHGAIAQGLGQAVLEMTAHDPGNGQPLTGSLMDYALPRADDLPSFSVEFNPTRCTTNPLGVKGCGEAGAGAAPPAIANAILDALAPLGVDRFDGPANPYRIWQAIRGRRAPGESR